MKRIVVFFVTSLLFVFNSCHRETSQTKYYSNGKIEEMYHIRNGKLSGSYRAYYKNGTLRGEGRYINGHAVGIWNYYYPSGNIMTIEKYNKKGKTVSFDAWDENGIQVVRDGTGIFVQYYPNGTIKSRAGYKDCMFDGANEAWYPNGNKEYEFYYKNGKPDSIWRFWNEDGVIFKTETY